ncbi:hypothetical protein EVB91_224 [Rhizobium phage RHph_I1_18]|nr:hypothetical protein EVB91_224 [Rhizobium phage RHph_I1_18]
MNNDHMLTRGIIETHLEAAKREVSRWQAALDAVDAAFQALAAAESVVPVTATEINSIPEEVKEKPKVETKSKRGGKRQKGTITQAQAVRAILADGNQLSKSDLRKRVGELTGYNVSVSSLHARLSELKKDGSVIEVDGHVMADTSKVTVPEEAARLMTKAFAPSEPENAVVVVESIASGLLPRNKPRVHRTKRADVIAVLTSAVTGLTTRLIHNELVRAGKKPVSEQAVHHHLYRMQEEGQVTQDGNGRWKLTHK